MAGGFDSLGLLPELIRAVDDLNWLLPQDCQDECIPLILGGTDVCCSAETGSGKTGAFGLPILQLVHEVRRGEAGTNEETKSSSLSLNNNNIFTSNDWKISTNDRDPIVAIDTETGLLVQARSPQWAGARCLLGIKNINKKDINKKFYYEVKICDEGLARVGWSLLNASYNLGTDAYGYGFGGTGKKSNNCNFIDYGESFTKNDIIGCYLNYDNNTISFSKNGIYLGVAYHLNNISSSTTFYPAFVIKNAEIEFNFGQKNFQYDPGYGYISLINASNEQIKKGLIEINNDKREEKNKYGQRNPLCIIIEPTRDLAEQVSNCLNDYKKYLNEPIIEHILLVGGMKENLQKKKIKEGVDIIIGTPGRICGFIKQKILSLNNIRFFIIDEADNFANNSDALKDLMFIYNQVPNVGIGTTRLQVCFFSATLHSPEIIELSEKITFHPTWVDLKGKDSVPETVHHVIYKINPENDISNLLNYNNNNITLSITDNVHNISLNNNYKNNKNNNYNNNKLNELNSEKIKYMKQQALLKIINYYDMDQCLIFCRTNLDCDNLERFLTNVGGGTKYRAKSESGKENKYSACVLAGFRSQNERRDNLRAFKSGEVRFLICTDVAARGIDIQNLPYVINMTLPDESENYVHRVGRVGRADCMGLAISIVADNNYKEKVWYHTCKNRGKGCTNRKLVSDKGCTIWYDETILLKDIEKRIHQDILQLNNDFSLPQSIANMNISYGETKDDNNTEISPNLELIKPTSRELAQLEYESQNLWLGLKLHFEDNNNNNNDNNKKKRPFKKNYKKKYYNKKKK